MFQEGLLVSLLLNDKCVMSSTKARTTKESIYIRLNNTTLNRNVGKYIIHHIWDIVLFNTYEFKISNDNGHVHKLPFSWYAQSIPTKRHVHGTIGHTGHAPTLEHAHRTS